jgi:hypothetical protein
MCPATRQDYPFFCVDGGVLPDQDEITLKVTVHPTRPFPFERVAAVFSRDWRLRSQDFKKGPDFFARTLVSRGVMREQID